MQQKTSGIGTAKKGIFFSLDAIIALTIMTVGLLLIANTYIAERQVSGQTHMSEDVAAVLGELRIDEVDNPLVSELIANGGIKGKALSNTILEQATQFWAEGHPDLATALIQNITEQQFPDLRDFNVVISDDVLYEEETSSKTLVIPMKRIVTGIARDEVTRGTIARAYLTGIGGKSTARYLYFGGFVGQGNITNFLTGIPADADIAEIYLEVDAGKNFTAYINGQQCGGLLKVSGGNMTADGFDLSGCTGLIQPGESVKNNFTIRFEGNTYDTNSFIAGGFLRVSYTTSELLDSVEQNTTRSWFPEIGGVINLYSSVSVPGTITSMDAYLHYLPNYTTSFLIGDVLVHEGYGGGAPQTHTISDAELDALLDYTKLSNQTIPLRMASFNLSLTETIIGGNVDVILITDFSGSMKKAVGDWSQGDSSGRVTACEATVYNKPNIRRTELALCLDKEVVNIIMDSTVNRLWPVHYRNDVVYNYTSADKANLMNYYEQLGNDQGTGKTCIGCALNRAYDILKGSSNASRTRYVILMTDGVPTHCPSDGCKGNSSVYGTKHCEGICDVPGQACGDIATDCNTCTTNNGPRNSTLYAAQRLRDDLNTTIYTVGFGPVDGCPLANELLQEVADIGNGTYNHSSNVESLREIYQAIALDIIERAELVSQMLIIEGQNMGVSALYGDSYLRINYTPNFLASTSGALSLAFESPKLAGCSDTVEIDGALTVTSARVTSYSSEHWTDGLTVNGQQVFNLSTFSENYSTVGDPYILQIPAEIMGPGTNSIVLRTGDEPTNETGCSLNNSLLYTVEINLTAPYGGVQPHSEGCIWSIEYEEGTPGTISVPPSPAPTKNCNFTSSSIAYDAEDAFDTAVFALLERLDFDDDGRVNIKFDRLDLTIVFVLVEEVPSLFGPTIAEVRTWQ